MTLESLIKDGESDTLEFKRDVPPDFRKYVKTVVAFSNGSGGRIVFGVDDDSRIVGIGGGKASKVRDSVTDAIAAHCSPIPDFSASVSTVDGKEVVVVDVRPGPERPYHISAEGVQKGTYVRVSGITRAADASTLRELQLEGSRGSFDARTNFDVEVLDADVERICSDLSAISGRPVTIQNLYNEGVLARKGGRTFPTNAYALLLGGVFRDNRIRCAMFKGKEKTLDKTMFLDRRECEGPVYRQIEDAYSFVLKNLRLESYTTPGIARMDVYEIPPEAVREAITNAVLHCSYLSTNPIFVALYDDRLEVVSPGRLYGGLTIDRMMEGATSRRNPVLGRIFALADISEGWGRGVRGMIDVCRAQGLKEPAFEEWGNDFKVTLYRRESGSGGQAGAACMTPAEFALYAFFESDPEASMSEAAEHMSVSLSTVKRCVRSLKDKGLLSRSGETSGGKWIVKRSAEPSLSQV